MYTMAPVTIHFTFHAVALICVWVHNQRIEDHNQPNYSLSHTIITRITSEEAFRVMQVTCYCEDEEMVEQGNYRLYNTELSFYLSIILGV